ncbi:hypothetical protein BAU15_04690 [Enterococcus sp. JM4C]|uniref:phytoene/squalene synthase family protein n=1 Tax=Candidatus Enterococcus huntleyi TaxID=1857217 RepID=UPI00137B0DE4|nr:phytoene/squalene synthase family protein [Enterococcus sp. JM4C]KAF1295836.1 hypothetical protein BAU15_04690 [Enterococcus sp. JM4C]
MKKQLLEADYSYCESVIKKNSKSFYTAFSTLPFPKNRAVYAIYAFCRMADDLVDNEENQKDKSKNITELAQSLEDFFNGDIPRGPVWTCLNDVYSKYEMNNDAFRIQLKGQNLDINFEQPETMRDMLDYSYMVASSVGLMLLPIVAQKNHQKLEETAINLGFAMQITNILRDIGEDYHSYNRIYLPKELMSKYSVTEEMIKQKVITAELISLWEYLAKEAEHYYQLFYEDLFLFDKDCQKQLIIASKVYSEILNVIRKDHYSFLIKKNKVSKKDMLLILNEYRSSVD